MDMERRWRTRRLTPTVYDFVIKNELLTRVAGRLLWNTDSRLMYATFEETGRLPEGSAVLDMPCGGGVALRGVSRAAGLRYVGADLSSVMLGRARAEAARRRVDVGFVQASAEHLPFPNDAFDRCITYNGLHCFPDPAAAIAELARVLRPGGTIAGTLIVSGAGAFTDLLLRFLRQSGAFGRSGSIADVRDWLKAAGLDSIQVTADGALARFRAVKP